MASMTLNTSAGDAMEVISFESRIPAPKTPSGVRISRIFYRGQKPTEKVIIGTIRQSVDLRPPLVYPNYIDHWIADPRLTYHTKYETLHKLKGQEIKNILGACGIMISPQRANAVWDYQLFSKVKSRYPGRFEGSMRKGVVGDWKNYYTRNCCEEITKIMGEFMLRQGYIKGLAWWKEFPDG
jgi:hypothetical protein